MTVESVKFDKQEIGKVIMKLSRICRACSKAAECPIFTSTCPIGMSRNLLAGYNDNQCQVRKEIDLKVVPIRPRDAVFPVEMAREVFEVIPELCNKCMFHVDKCFLNVVFGWMEVVVQVSPRKAWSARPVPSTPPDDKANTP